MAEFEALTFDCYGTLIDWHAGVRAAAREMKSLEGVDVDAFVRARDAADRRLIQKPWRPYASIVAESARVAALELGRRPSDDELASFASSMRRWPPFDESRAMLTRLATRHRLAILSNVDSDVLEASIEALGVPFERSVTAGRIHSYKPAHAHWQIALRELNLARERVLHVGCSLFHDIRPATELGFATAFVDRDGEGLSPGDAPSLIVRDLAGLCAALGC